MFRRPKAVGPGVALSAIAWLAVPAPCLGQVQFGGNVAGLYVYDLEVFAYLAGQPGSALPELRDDTLGLTIGQMLVGQTNVPVDWFDFVSGTPAMPLRIDDTTPPEYGLNISTVYSRTVMAGLGPLGFPHRDSLGEGALTILFDADQYVVGVEVIGVNDGPMSLTFYNRGGSVIGQFDVPQPLNDTYVYSSVAGDIAALTINNHDLGGLAYGNLLFLPGVPSGPPVCQLSGPYVFPPQDGLVAVPLQSGVTDPNGASWTYDWSTDCPGPGFDDPAAQNPTLYVDASGGCAVTCSVAVMVTNDSGIDMCGDTVEIEGAGEANVTCPADATTEADGSGNVAELNAWLAAATADSGVLQNDFSGLSDGCGMSGSATVTWWVDGACGASSCSATFTVTDTTPPVLQVDSTPIVVQDTDCDGSVTVDMPAATAYDPNGGVVTLTYDDPLELPAGASTLAAYTATDDCGNVTTVNVPVDVLQGGVYEAHVTVGSQPAVGVTVLAFDASSGSCAGSVAAPGQGLSQRQYAAIVAGCAAISSAVTDANGVAIVDVPDGQYLIVALFDDNGDGTPDAYAGQHTGRINCGHWKVGQLRR